jgi:hypothetical protein
LGKLSKAMPGGKAFAELLAIERSAQQMSLEREVLSALTKMCWTSASSGLRHGS